MDKRIDGKWIYFVQGVNNPKTQVWHIYNTQTNEWLGDISWFPTFRKYSFRSVAHADREHSNGLSDIWFEEDCLREIADFCERLTKEHYTLLETGYPPCWKDECRFSAETCDYNPDAIASCIVKKEKPLH